MISRHYGTLADGTAVEEFVLSNGALRLHAITYGGIITELWTPDRQQRPGNVVLGYGSLEQYVRGRAYVGAIIGRYANRIAGGRFTVDGHSHQLATNDGPNHLHGGERGFDKQVWRGEMTDEASGSRVTFTRTSPDGEERYPGALTVQVSYTVTAQNEVVIDYQARTNAATIVNITQHTYFNLTGEPDRGILDHDLRLHAGHYTPVDETLIPTGEIAHVAGTPFDFRTATRIGAHLDGRRQELLSVGGYDHNFVLQQAAGRLRLAAELYDGHSGRTLELRTTEPGLQFYAGHLLPQKHTGCCLETQHFPDSPNNPAFPSTVLTPATAFQSTTTWKFGNR